VVSVALLGLDHAHTKERAICQMNPFRRGGAHIVEMEYDLCAPPLHEYPINKVQAAKRYTYKLISRSYSREGTQVEKSVNIEMPNIHVPPRYDAYNL